MQNVPNQPSHADLLAEVEELRYQLEDAHHENRFLQEDLAALVGWIAYYRQAIRHHHGLSMERRITAEGLDQVRVIEQEINPDHLNDLWEYHTQLIPR